MDYISGSPLKVGVHIGGRSQGGELRNLQFNPHYWNRVPRGANSFYNLRPRGGIKSSTGKLLWEYQKENMDAIIISDTENQLLYQNFVYGSLYGIRFTTDGYGGPRNLISHGHGTDGSKIGAFFQHGSEQITMINSELVAMSSDDKIGIKLGPEFNAKAVFINTMVWGTPDLVAEVENGFLWLQNMTARRHGDGIRFTQGEVYTSNMNFLNQTNTHIQRQGSGRGEFNAIIVRPRFIENHSSSKPATNFVVERPLPRRRP